MTFPRRMLLRNIPWICIGFILTALYIIYSVDHGIGGTHEMVQKSSSAEHQSSQGTEKMTPVSRHPQSEQTNSLSASTPQKGGGQKKRVSPLFADAKSNSTKLKTILYWNEFYGRYDTFDFGYGHEAFVEKGCAYSGCFATKDRTILPIDQFDAIIIHIRGLPNDWPKKRSDFQRYIMLSIDPPIQLYEYRHLSRLDFNWTMTYRLDSDFPIPYAWIDKVMPLPAPIGSTQLARFISNHGRHAVTHGPNLAENKIGLAVQFVSNCHSNSKREAYVRELRQHIPVDVYGKCGEFKCPKENGWECYRQAESKYKFYLSFENAMCRDYVTEKFFTIYSLNMIPVVLGGANYSAIAPPHSYIDAADFPDPKSLAHYLKLVDSDSAKFNEYFWWKDYYRRSFHHHQTLCDVCEKLHTSQEQRVYPNMKTWWVDDAHCSSSNQIKNNVI